ncbi:unnamed protein product [Choristocarpus tenellus]
MGKSKGKPAKKVGKQASLTDGGKKKSEDLPSKKDERAERSRLKHQRQREAQEKHISADEDKIFADQVRKLGGRIKYITGDGNCLFRSIADQLEGKQHEHVDVRQKIMDYMEKNRDTFEPYMEDDEPFDAYIKRLRRNGEWGGHQELFAASQLLKVNILVHQFQAPRFEIQNVLAGHRSFSLSYHGEYHYNSVRANSDSDTGPATPLILGSPYLACVGEGGREGQRRGLGGGSNSTSSLKGENRQSHQKESKVTARSSRKDSSRSDKDSSVLALGLVTHDAKDDGGERGKSPSTSKGNKSSSSSRGGRDGKVPRAASCPCGSGVKYKDCCRKKELKTARAKPADQQRGCSSVKEETLEGDFGSLVI